VFQGDLTVRQGVGLVAAPAPESLDGETAFERAYASEFPHVYGYIRYRVGGTGSTADDLTAQTFLQALDRLSTFDPRRAEIGQWMLGIARNVVRDHLRAGRRWGWLPLDWLWDRASPDPNPEERAIGGEERQRLLEALGELSDRDRDILGLKFAGGLTNRAIARLSGLGESHVGVIVYRAVGKLRARLEGEEVRGA
jgi:RNA polymerase sigma-70 factor (ECF subfamily)